MGRAISTLVDTAAEHASELALEAVQKATEAASTLSPPVIALNPLSRRARRRARRHARGTRRWPLVAVFGVGAIVAVVVITRRRQASQYDAANGPAPDAFGAAVEAEQHAMSHGDGHHHNHPVATPGA
ncbi:MAG: hypothetical protein QOI55_2823 [Actinomycetota bacterium]|nr:hypothetical protein [Actinomycetota bacterium]